MFDEACKYLFYRREFSDLLFLIRNQYEQNKISTESYKKKIKNAREISDSDEFLKNAKESRQVEMVKWEEKRDATKLLREYWFS